MLTKISDMTNEKLGKKVELAFFNYHLKDKGQLNLPEALVFETGSNKWKRHDAWPPKNMMMH